MTTPSPRDVRNVYYADLFNGSGWVDLDPISIEWSADQDRVNYGQATIVLPWVSDEVWALLDPRTEVSTLNQTRVRWAVEQWGEVSGADVRLARFPVNTIIPGTDAYARMWLRTAERDYVNRRTVVTLATGESRLTDKIRNAGTTANTGATTVTGLVDWALAAVFGGYALTTDVEYVDVAISGDQRLHLPGESYLDLFRSELDGANARLIDEFGIRFRIRWRPKVTDVLRLATMTIEEGAPSNADPIVFGLTDEVSRDGDFADGVLIEYNYRNSSGTQVVAYQASGLGVNTKGIQRTFARPAPAGNAADQMVTRAVTRGRDVRIDARLRLDALPNQTVIVTTAAGFLAATVRSVTYRPESNSMTIQARTGDDY